MVVSVTRSQRYKWLTLLVLAKPGTRSVARLVKATYRPSALIWASREKKKADRSGRPAWLGAPAAWETSVVVSVTRSWRNTSKNRLSSTCPGARLGASLMKAAYLPSALSDSRPGLPFESGTGSAWETSSTVAARPAERARTPARRSVVPVTSTATCTVPRLATKGRIVSVPFALSGRVNVSVRVALRSKRRMPEGVAVTAPG